MTSPTRLSLLIVPMAALPILAFPAHALDMTGAWATDAAACAKLFVKKGKNFAFRSELEVPGGGFIVDGKYDQRKNGKLHHQGAKRDRPDHPPIGVVFDRYHVVGRAVQRESRQREQSDAHISRIGGRRDLL